MRALEETLSRWQATSDCVADLRRAVKDNGPSSPCLSGCRSVCWKTFLLSTDASRADLAQVLRRDREEFTHRRSHFLRFIHHPEALAQLTIDPLADDPESPWNTVRRDEVIRAEIRQDVQRLPDEANYHQDWMQTMILDILFIYCKVNPNRGGYRQGMHELLAPIVNVVEQDAIDRSVIGADPSSLDQSMLEVLDSSYVEHDAYLLFSRVMERAQSFYEVQDSSDSSAASRMEPGYQESRSAIVERSKFIHEVCLHSVDQELASHLMDIEILPQIFLIRWVRLLFSREFPLDQVLELWDAIFAVDPSLDLIDFICCAMLVRIRHQLLEADYSACLRLLLKYPPPAPPHGPHTFVDDALYLRDHMNAAGRDALVVKYTGKAPETSSAPPGSPDRRGLNHFRPRGFGGRSPLPSPSRFIQQQGRVESLFQGAAKSAKGVLERGEKLGLNQAVRDAVVEFRRNMQTFNETRQSEKTPRNAGGEGAAAEALAAMERRNKQLAALLDETVANLKAVTTSSLDDKAKSLDLIEVAAAKIQFVQVYLSDSSLEVPSGDVPAAKEPQTVSWENTTSTPKPSHTMQAQEQDLDVEGKPILPKADESEVCRQSAEEVAGAHGQEGSSRDLAPEPVRPAAPIPTRSALAQSSFSWMLEPGELVSSQPLPSASQFPAAQHKRPSSNASRERNAFLFGEVATETITKEPPNGDEVFGLETIRKPKNKP
ncbi:rab-GTPase-TBC domain-containing protein [Hirsutella rhossiliensis]|uniref:Rab-GTPase-TBC domain-containing protein n=1 Tax=Hirsutella rhossiliensis TaxID=111463 RepID=A0A9P8MX85_9HYPO|nr:rab-GTPase-TBC domain-containing protein [Hirsutella rhossiliensis]KAH0963017.1 rab-GTPase-TBC domain-containing protein [Hirsutella rhossiliensis]